MARENQGYLIWIIILSLTTVVFGVCTFLGFSGNAENRQQRQKAEQSLQSANKRNNAFDAYVKVLKADMGIEGQPAAVPDLISSVKSNDAELGTDVDRSQAAFQKQVDKSLSEGDNKDATLVALLSSYEIAMGQLHDRVSAIDDQKNKLIEEKQASDVAHAEEIKAKLATIGGLEAQLKAEQTRNAEKEQVLTTQLDEIKSQFAELTKKLSDEEESFRKQIADLTSEQQRLEKIVQEKSQQIALLTRVDTDVADGRITDIAPGSDRVYIDLGAADGLRTKQRFAVYDRSETIYEKYLGKAFIEVTEVQGAHRAVARKIPEPKVEDVIDYINLDERAGRLSPDQASNLRVQVINKRRIINPVLTGDYIVSDVWDPGYAVAVALAGTIDVDGDGISDLNVVQSRIEQNGGRVVAKEDENGEVTGAIDASTRYLVIGDEPTNPASLKGYTELIEAGKKYGTQQLSLRELYHALGFQGEARVERLDAGGSTNFVPRLPPQRPSEKSATAERNSGVHCSSAARNHGVSVAEYAYTSSDVK